jgi:Zn-dependent protease
LGIPVRIHWSFFVVIYLIATFGSSQGDGASTMLSLAIVFVSVFLHELGHCLMARRLGIRVLDITFWPLGGMARMSHMPEDARVEGLVAAAGPMVNFLLAGVGILLLPLGQASEFYEIDWVGPLIFINLLIGTFNLIPAFPMDGGRILRACLARNNDWLSATSAAVKVGRFFAGLMILSSITLAFKGYNNLCALPLIAAFIWFSGAKELLAVRIRHGESPFAQMGGFGQNPFQGAAGPSEEQPRDSRPGEQIVEPSPGSARRTEERNRSSTQQGFSAEDIAGLENFRGRLGQKPPEDDA